MLSAILQKVAGVTVLEFLTPRLFEPLGIENPTWESDPEGINVGGWGLSVTTEDISKLGQLYLQKGVWEGKQLISEAWVEQLNQKLKGLAISSVKGDQSSPMVSEVSGKTYFMESFDSNIQTISFKFDSSPVQIKISTSTGEYTLNSGYQEPEFGQLPNHSLLSNKVAVSGAWEDASTYTAHFIYYETPQSTKMTFRFKGNKLTWDTENKASFGPANLPQMVGRAQ